MSDGYAKDRTLIFIEVEDMLLEWWSEFHLHSNLLQGPDTFQFSAPLIGPTMQREMTARGLRVGQQCRVYVTMPGAPKPTLQCTGRILTVDADESVPGGSHVNISGKGHLHRLCDGDLLPSLGLEGATFAEIARRILTERFGYSTAKIVTNNDANRMVLTGKAASGTTLSKEAPVALEAIKVDQAKPHAGETAFHYLQRHARRFGLLVWGTADGGVVIGRPNYTQKPLYELSLRSGAAGHHNTAKSMSRRRTMADRAAEYHVFGKSHGHDDMSSPIHAVVYDEEVIAAFGRDEAKVRLLTVHDNNARTKAEAEQRAKLERAFRMQGSDFVRARAKGFGSSDGTTYALDTTASVVWPKQDIDDTRYIVGRSFEQSKGGTHSMLELIPLNSIALGTL